MHQPQPAIHAALALLAASAATLAQTPQITQIAQDDAPPSAPAEPQQIPHDQPWSVQLDAILWAPGLRGDVAIPAGSTIDVETINADENRLAPAGRLTVRAEPWVFQFEAFAFAIDTAANATQAFDAGDLAAAADNRVDYELELASFEATLGRTVWTPVDQPENDLRLAFDLYAGLRAYDLDLDLSVSRNPSASEQLTWAEPIAGFRMNLDLPEGFDLRASLDLGYLAIDDNESFSWDVTVAFAWQFIDNGALQIGFRHLDLDISEGDGSDEFGLDGSLAGLFGSVVIRF